MKGLIGKKIGMTRVYDEQGKVVPVTVVKAGPCTVVSVRTPERDRYSALQLAFGQRKEKNLTKPVLGQLRKAGLATCNPEIIREVRLESGTDHKVGDVLNVDVFAANEFVDVIGTTKGRGFAGVVRRHHFAGGRASHGGGWLRRGGSNGMKEHPGRVLKNHRMPGHMGNERRTVQNLRVVQVLPDDNLLLIKGSIPGANGNFVMVRQARKK